MNNILKIASSIFLVAGTCVGGGMLGLPVATGMNGLIPSLMTMLSCCLVMTLTAFLYLEVLVYTKKETHVLSMTETLLGKNYKIFIWLLYLFMSYASLVAYASGGGSMVSSFLRSSFTYNLSPQISCIIYILIFGTVSSLGEKLVGKVNSILFILMIISYFLLIGPGMAEIDSKLLLYQDYNNLTGSIPILLTTFSFQAFIIPGISGYLSYNVKHLKIVLIGGVLLTLFIYGLWQLLVLGTVPVHGPYGLATALEKGHPATDYLQRALSNPMTAKISLFFSFFALTTSFMGMTMGLNEFLSDGIKVTKKCSHKLFILLLIIIPTIFFATQLERVFIKAMDTTGGFGDTILNGLLPISFVWALRYKRKINSEYRVFGGKALLIILFIAYSLFFLQELFIQIN